ncbi:MAG TPA: hypothetical protein VKY92_12180 [Verrucomicrobiae bacterium]|jgi:predicted transcriptional regulator|nr:hypothetical protein [Verrucomicrobiae bacterium]
MLPRILDPPSTPELPLAAAVAQQTVGLERWACVQYAKGYIESMSAKEAVLQAIHRLPDDVDYRAIGEEIAFLAALEQGDRDIHSGRVVSNEDAKKRLESWTSS